eukprot:TRINITY_DN2629_c0_g1_i2.p1 TRINITY_DN2629_c0_g1~~TRINITY_DN2629_c0_g1_i2.p1  ORF type:complete len:140 (+),score=24.52 TRINITY_DN2629_c0_g1_i2:269-688(+)
MAHQAIIQRTIDDKNNEQISDLVKDYEGQPLLGPHTIVISDSLNSLFFTDSGPFCETSIENPKVKITHTQIYSKYLINKLNSQEIFFFSSPSLIQSPLRLNQLAYKYHIPVSYTHLTLPTICSVQISVVAVSLKKKKSS